MQVGKLLATIKHLLQFLHPQRTPSFKHCTRMSNDGLRSSLDITANRAAPQISAGWSLQDSPCCAALGMLLLSASHVSKDTESVLCFGWSAQPLFTFSRWMSFLIWDILIFMASSSSSGTSGMLGTASDSSTIWKLRSVSGMYHLQSYCWLFLKDRSSKPLLLLALGNTHSLFPRAFPHYSSEDTEMGTTSLWLPGGKNLAKDCAPVRNWSIQLSLLAKPRTELKLRCKVHSPERKSHPPICFLSLAHRNRSVKRKTWRSLRAPSTSSTMKLSFRSCRCWWKTEKMFWLVQEGPR